MASTTLLPADANHPDEQQNNLVTLFDSVCMNYGDADAVVVGTDYSVCYTELYYSSLNLARQLYYRYGRPDAVLVDCCCANNNVAAEIVAVTACMRASIPFCPVDTTNQHSGTRLQAVVDTLRQKNKKSQRIAAIVVATGDADPVLAPFVAAGVHNLIYISPTGDLLEPMQVPEQLPDPIYSQSDDLYILFTSGTSSGQPKAVVGSHRSTIKRLQWFQREFPANLNTVIARKTPLTFVDGVNELLMTCIAPVQLYPFQAANGLAAILESPCERVTLLPSQLAQLLIAAQNSGAQCTLQLIVISGEPCPVSLLNDFIKCAYFHNTQLLNLYGQTETTGDCTWAVLAGPNCDDDNDTAPVVRNVVPVGRPLPGVTIQLSAEKNELVVSGSCLSNGYHGTTTSDKWQSFATGDVGFCENECWYVQGRVDDVCKINGIWTAPTEVEACFQQVYRRVCVAVILDGTVYAMVQAEQSAGFSREQMHEEGVPWNLIPKQVFEIEQIPKSTGGAGKVNRSRVKELVQGRLDKAKAPHLQASGGSDPDALLTLLSIVLNVSIQRIQQEGGKASFVELGGDSALAVTLLYKLKVAGLLAAPTTAKDIILTDSIQELRGVLSGVQKAKKRKTDPTKKSKFQPRQIEQPAEGHAVVHFAACVDAAPVIHENFVYGACQGGVVQRIDVLHTREDSLPACFLLGDNWKAQANLITIKEHDTLVVCGYDPEQETGIVFALSMDLATVKWKRKLDGTIKSTPVIVNGHVHVLAGSCLFILDSESGKDAGEVDFQTLQAASESKPAVVVGPGGKDDVAVVYAFSDWDAGLAIVKPADQTTRIVSNVACPVYADLLAIGDYGRVIAADITGYLHDVDCRTLQVKSTKVASSPIFSAPVLTEDGNIVFGCHDGLVRCVSAADLSVTLWQYDTKSVVYARVCPLVRSSSHVAVCTTAGDVLVLKDGVKVVWRARVEGEIWSNVVMFRARQKDGAAAVMRLVFGARDSKLHIMTIPPV